jgi:hypothetical protein
MAQTGFTPIKIYSSTTPAATPTAGNLEQGELAINTNDGKLFYEDSSGVVQVLATKDAATGNFTTVDTTNLEVTNLKAKDGTAAGSIADSTGVVTLTTLAGTTANITTVNATTLDATNLEVTNLKAKDGTAAGSIADSTGVVTLASSVLTTTDINGGTVDNTAIGATTASTVRATQVDIIAQGDLRLQDTTGGEFVALQAPGTLATSYTLTLPVDDGTSGQALITDGSGVLSWSTAASGDVYGPASATDNAIARYDGTTGKIIQNSAVTIADDGATVIAANSTSDGLRITQTGTGNALVVEDSANPDATPFVVDAGGKVIVGHTSAVNSGAPIQIVSTSAGGFAASNFSGDVNGTVHSFWKARGTIDSPTIVQSNDTISRIDYSGYDGASYVVGARITASVDGTPGTNDMPGRLVFSTTRDGASSPTEAVRIDSAGQVSIGTGTTTGVTLRVNKNITGATTAFGVYAPPAIQSDVTSAVQVFGTFPSVVDSSFTLGLLSHFSAAQGTKGASATLTTQYGFIASSTLTGATNNYGFYSNIASGTGRWNFYAAGTADNYFAGNVRIGNASSLGSVFGSFAPVQIAVSGGIAQSIFNYAGNAFGPRLDFSKSRGGSIGTQTIVQSGDVLGEIYFGGSDGTAFIPAAQISTQVDGTPGTNDMPGRLIFSTTADGASSLAERMRIDNAGRVGIGGTPTSAVRMYLGGNISGNVNNFGLYTDSVFQSGVTTFGGYFTSNAQTAAASFTLPTIGHFNATQGTFGAGSTVTNQYGFSVGGSLIGATNNFGFHSNIASGTGRWNFYAAGSADNYFAGRVAVGLTSGFTSSKLTSRGDDATSSNFAFVAQNSSGTNLLLVRNDGLVTATGLSTSRTAVTAPAATDGNVFSGTYTPTLTNVTNVASSTAVTCQYMRVGNVVTVSGQVSITATAGAATTVLDMSLPIASAFTLERQAGGVFSNGGNKYGRVAANATDDRFSFSYNAPDASVAVMFFNVTYQVI